MKNKRKFFDLFLGVAAIVMILISVKSMTLSNSNESENSEKKAIGPAPSVLRLSNRSFAVQPNDRLILTNPPHVNKQFDYTVEGEAAVPKTTTFFPVLYVTSAGTYENNVVYCIDVEKQVPAVGNDYTPVKASAALSYLAKNGLIAKQGALTVDTELDYFATQVAVYSVLGQTSKDTAYENLTEPTASTVRNKINSLVSAANQATFDVVFNSTGTKTLTKVDGQSYYESGLITVTATQNNPQINLTTSFTGAQIINSSNQVITGAVASGTQIKIRVPEANLATGNNTINVSASINAKIDQGYTYETTATTGNQPILLAETFEEDATGTGNIVFTANKDAAPDPTYEVQIRKVDESRNPLAGARLVLKNSLTNEIVKAEWTTTSSSVTVSGLKAGSYYIEETYTPTGYRPSNNITFSVPDQDGTVIDVVNTLVPEEKGNITINKVDQDGQGLAGAIIILQNSQGTEVGRYTTTAGNWSHTFTDLPVGSYTIIESQAPVGYRKSDNINVTVKNNETTTQNVVNNLTSITIIKHNENDQPLEGVVLEIINSQGNVVYEWTTDSTGTHTITGIPVGTYNIREKQAPDGYTKTDSLFPFTIQHGSTTPDVIIKNYKTVVKINKVDGNTNELIGGANLVVKDSEGNIVKSFISNGSVYELYDLVPGTYTVEETKAPDGYALQTEKVSFTVKEDSKEVNVTFTNNKLVVVPPTSFNISKILFVIGLAFILIGGLFTYYYVKTPQDI